MILVVAVPLMVSCSKDDNGSTGDSSGGTNTNGNGNTNPNPNPPTADIHVVVNEDGTTSNGSLFSAIDDKNFYVDYIKYTVKEGHLIVSGYDESGFKGVANIVARITYKGSTYEVLEIGAADDYYTKSAFRGCSGLTSVTIPNTVTSIGQYAFFGCTGLTSVTIPNSVKYICSGAFKNCNSLTSVHIADLASWCKISFGNYNHDVNESNPLYYAHHMFLNGAEVENLVVPNGVKEIKSYAFSGCTGLTSVSIPNSVASIGYYAFSGCTGLTSVGIPNSVTSIGGSAFSGCTGLTSVSIPNSVTSIGDYAFRGCSGLLSPIYNSTLFVDMPRTYRGDYSIPEGITNICSSAFSGCTGLTSVSIPNSVTSIGYYAFSGCI